MRAVSRCFLRKNECSPRKGREKRERGKEGAKKSTTTSNYLLAVCVCAYGAMGAPASRRARARSRCRSRGAAREGRLSFSLGEQSRLLAGERGAERASANRG